MMNNARIVEVEATNALRTVLGRLPELRVQSTVSEALPQGRSVIVFIVHHGTKPVQLGVEAYSRVTPQTVLSICQKIKSLAPGLIPVIYAPVISPRVADILRENRVGYFDRAGNSWIVSPENNLLIERQGFLAERPSPRTVADLFSPKSSRIVRAMLREPMKGWQVRELQADPNVKVSAGLVVKVKAALLEEGYAIEHQRRLYLRDPAGLLKAWAASYSGPAEQLHFYLRGDVQAAEVVVRDWCSSQRIEYALAGLSAAWKQAPEVRYLVATAYVEDRGLERTALDQMAAVYGAKRVDTGANLTLWRAYDPSVFAFSASGDEAPTTTSPIQTYLDVSKLPGRGEDAAKTVYKVYLDHIFHAAAEQAKEWTNG